MKASIFALLFSLCLFPGVALAHTVGVEKAIGFMQGFSHPIGGMDHLLAMLAVGLYATHLGGRALWIVPSSFIAVMTLGGFLGFSGMPLPFIEGGILFSLCIFGILMAFALKTSIFCSALIVGFFAVFHGHAHGTEIPTAINATSYTLGFVLSTAMLHVVGMSLGMFSQKLRLPVIYRFSGTAIAFSGFYLAIS